MVSRKSMQEYPPPFVVLVVQLGPFMFFEIRYLYIRLLFRILLLLFHNKLRPCYLLRHPEQYNPKKYYLPIFAKRVQYSRK